MPTNSSETIPKKIEEERVYPNSIYKASITLLPKLNKNTKRKNCRPIFLMNIDVKMSTNSEIPNSRGY